MISRRGFFGSLVALMAAPTITSLGRLDLTLVPPVFEPPVFVAPVFTRPTPYPWLDGAVARNTTTWSSAERAALQRAYNRLDSARIDALLDQKHQTPPPSA